MRHHQAKGQQGAFPRLDGALSASKAAASNGADGISFAEKPAYTRETSSDEMDFVPVDATIP